MRFFMQDGDFFVNLGDEMNIQTYKSKIVKWK